MTEAPAVMTHVDWAVRLSRDVWPDDVLDRVEDWINARFGGDADVRTIAAALIAALPGGVAPR